VISNQVSQDYYEWFFRTLKISILHSKRIRAKRDLCNQGYEVSYTVVLTEKLQQLKKYQEMDGITRNKSLRIPINKI
jgi:hypothetical protein